MNIIPIEGLGVLITGPEQKQPVEIWHDSLVTLTRLPHGRCLIPMLAGIVKVVRAGKVLAQIDIAEHRVAEPGEGRFELKSTGAICVWPFYPELDAGILAGEPAAASKEHSIDLSRLKMPHQIMTLAVQVIGARRHGPVRFFSYRPDAAPSPVSIDHAHGLNGPITHVMVDSLGLPSLQLEVVHKVRQTGAVRKGRYEITSPEDRITFENLLHGDELNLIAAGPYALAGTNGPVQGLHYRYRAVPEPRLERMPEQDPLSATGGVTLIGKKKVVEILGPLTGTAPTWRQEFPLAGAGVHATLVAAVQDKMGDVEANFSTNAKELAWWIRAVETGQDMHAAKHLRDAGIDALPDDANEVAAAIMFLDTFPAHLFKELGARGPTDAIVNFQEMRGLGKTDGALAAQLASETVTAVHSATGRWVQRISEAGLDWIDGALPPLAQSSSVEDLADLLRSDAEAGLQELWERRRRIWQVVSSPTDGDVDLEARKSLLAWHLKNTQVALDTVADLFGKAGVELPKDKITDVTSLARRLSNLVRAAEPAVVRVGAAPIKGSGLVERAAARAVDTIDHIHSSLSVWANPRVPAAMRLPTERALERWNRRLITRAEVWATLLAQHSTIERELLALQAAGEPGAGRLLAALNKAVTAQDPAQFAALQADLQRVEKALDRLRTDWAKMLRDSSAGTKAALGLTEVISWDDVRDRVEVDYDAIAKTASKLAPAKRSARLDNDIVRLGDAKLRVAEASQDGMIAALAAYDKARSAIAGPGVDGDPVATIAEVQRKGLVEDLETRIEEYIGDVDASVLAALAHFDEIEGAGELHDALQAAMRRGLNAAEAQALHASLDKIQDLDAPWERICALIDARLWPLRAELSRYMGPAAPRWSTLREPRDAIHWLHAICNGHRDEQSDSDPALMAPGNRRLLEHTLQQKGLWIR